MHCISKASGYLMHVALLAKGLVLGNGGTDGSWKSRTARHPYQVHIHI